MIKIEIYESKYPGNPQACQIPKSQVELFLDGFKELCNKTGMHKVDTYAFGTSGQIPTSLNFDDGTHIGMRRLFEEIGFNYKND